MIKKEDLLEAIAECQGQKNPNANTCIKLAAYYTILNNMDCDMANDASYSFAQDPIGVGHIGDSDFLNKIEGKDVEEVLRIVDELMTTLQVVNPRLYDGMMRKI